MIHPTLLLFLPWRGLQRSAARPHGPAADRASPAVPEIRPTLAAHQSAPGKQQTLCREALLLAFRRAWRGGVLARNPPEFAASDGTQTRRTGLCFPS